MQTRTPPARRTVVEQVVRHERTALAATLVVVPLACWAWIVPMARDMYGSMSGPSAWMMTANWDAGHVLLLAAMWIVMMAAMMLPSAAPTLLMYAGAARHRAPGHGPRAIYAMAAGYLAVWAGFSVAATILQRLLSAALVLTPMMELRSPLVSGAVLVVAGVYQFTPLKRACLGACSAPLVFLMRRWRDGTAGAFRLGLEHGLYCVGCCWALMLLLFVGGVMNLAVIGGLTLFVLIEKLTPLGSRGVRITGGLLVAWGIWIVSSQ